MHVTQVSHTSTLTGRCHLFFVHVERRHKDISKLPKVTQAYTRACAKTAVSRGSSFGHHDLMPPKYISAPPCWSLAISKGNASYIIKLLTTVVLSMLHDWKLIAALNFTCQSPYLGRREPTSKPSSAHFPVTAAAPYVKWILVRLLSCEHWVLKTVQSEARVNYLDLKIYRKECCKKRAYF